MQLKIISAGAGSGKTYRLTQEMVALLKKDVRPGGIIATTFTKKAAAELQERVRVQLLKAGMPDAAEAIGSAMIGTVHSLGVRLLQRFAYEAGVSPEVAIIAEEDHQMLFNQSLTTVLSEAHVQKMEAYREILSLDGTRDFDWRKEVRLLTEIARANGFDAVALQESAKRSFASFRELLDEPDQAVSNTAKEALPFLLSDTVGRILGNGDTTKKTAEVVQKLRAILRELELRGRLPWKYYVELEKLEPAKKSKGEVEELRALVSGHLCFPEFHADLQGFTEELFGLVAAAMQEYAAYKQRRGLIDYTDMEVLVDQLLDRPDVRAVLMDELDLLMVDEFQDTSPIQLEIFLKLSRLSRYSVWVGDPKQSIYGFRGAAPELMHAIIAHTGGIRKEDIQSDSWRSREDLVSATNAIFCRAFPDMETAQVALNPKRLGANDPAGMGPALNIWKFDFDQGEAKSSTPPKQWMENSIAFALRDFLGAGAYVMPKGEPVPRPVRAGDVAVLCRTNSECALLAEALNSAGLKVAISRSGLMQTAEARLILACLKYLLHAQDTLSVAEILLLAENLPVEEMIEDRLAYLEKQDAGNLPGERWGAHYPMIRMLQGLRPRVAELSCAETLDLLLGELDLRRIIAGWGNISQRLDNVEVFRKLAAQYEDSRNRLQAASALGGFLLWLNRLEAEDKDFQSAGESQDAVNVLTYHSSKGLEWPVVICHNLEASLRAEVWGADIRSDCPEVDLENLLGNRHLYYWVNPYDKQGQKTALADRIAAHPVQAHKRARALAEERRLLYVGLTRARDYLIFPLGHQPTSWLNRTWHEGQGDVPTFDLQSPESPWAWNGKTSPIAMKTWSFGRVFPPCTVEEQAPAFLAPPAGKKIFPPLFVQPMQAQPGVIAYAGNPFVYGYPLADVPDEILGKIAIAYLQALYPDYPEAVQLEIAASLINDFGLGETLRPEQLRGIGADWQRCFEAHFPAANALRQYVLRERENGRIFETEIDLLLHLPQGRAIVQHVAFSGEPTVLPTIATEYFGHWASLCRQSVRKAEGLDEVRVLIHFVAQKTLIELYWPDELP
ncbi:MAG: UvrD-helicase domain-containing protein [Saprospiraceae bacterium]